MFERMKFLIRKVIFVSCLLVSVKSISQDGLNIPTDISITPTTFYHSDNKSNYYQNNSYSFQNSLPDSVRKKRLKYLVIANSAAYAGTMIVLYDAWYKDYKETKFHFFNDNAEYLQMDKMSHAWATYNVSRATSAMWQWGGMPYKKSIWIGGLSGLAFETIIEVLDGFSSEWGFSCGDMLANVTGSTLYVSQELLWKEQRIQLKASFHENDYSYSKQLNDRANSFYGNTFLSRLIKDYNAENYWLSFNLKSFFKNSNLPDWLSFSIGHGATNMFGAITNDWTDANGNAVSRNDLQRYRRFHFAPDVDLTKIKTKSKFLRSVFFALNSLKFPTPSLELSQGKVKWNWIMF